jgi:hypothetical protein
MIIGIAGYGSITGIYYRGKELVNRGDIEISGGF